MPRHSRALRRGVDDRQGATILAPVPYSPPAGLTTLPALGNVPLSAHFEQGHADLGELATGLARAGILQPCHFTNRDLRAAINSALSQTVTPYSSQWRLIKDHVACSYTHDVDALGHPHMYDDRKHEKSAIFFACDRERSCYYIGDVLRRIEADHPGAGKSLMVLVEMGLNCGFGGITPQSCLQMCQEFYWWGELDERERLKEIREETAFHAAQEKTPVTPMDDEQICREYGMPTMAQVREWFPEDWSYNMGWAPYLSERCLPKGQRPDFARIAPKFPRPLRCGNGKAIREAANDLLAHLSTFYADMLAPARLRHINDLYALECTSEMARPAMYRWHDRDGMTMVYDDYMMDLEQGGETSIEICAVFCMDPTNTASCQSASRRLHAALQATTLTDRLLSFFVSNKSLAQVFGEGDPRIRTQY